MNQTELSICIPTYNRATLLQICLKSIISQIQDDIKDKIEIIVSDNCSEDNTQELVNGFIEFHKDLRIEYYRHDRNIGGIINAINCVQNIATGNFVWLMGDDDFLRDGAINRIIDIIEHHPEVCTIFVNATPVTIEILERYSWDLNRIPLSPTKAKKREDRCPICFDQLIDPDIDDVFLGSMMCLLFRREFWNNDLSWLNIKEPFSNLDSTYWHSLIIAKAAVGKAAFFVGYPYIIPVWGNQSWSNYVPMIVLVRFPELLDFYESLGVDKVQIEKCRRALIKSSGYSLARLTKRETKGKEYFNLKSFIINNYKYKEFYVMIVKAVINLLLININPKNRERVINLKRMLFRQ